MTTFITPSIFIPFHRPQNRFLTIKTRPNPKFHPITLCTASKPTPTPPRDTDARGFLLPHIGDIVLYAGRWADEDSVGLVEGIQFNPSRNAHIVDILPLRRVTNDLFAIPSGKNKPKSEWHDPASLRIIKSPEYIKQQDAYRIPSTNDGYAPISPPTPEQAAVTNAEYQLLKRQMLITTTITGLAGTLLITLFQGTDTAMAFATGAVASLAYLRLLQAGVDNVGVQPSFASRLFPLRYLMPVLPFLALAAIKNGNMLEKDGIAALLRSVPKEQAFAIVLGLLSYKMPLVLRTAGELVDSAAQIEMGKTGMVGTAVALGARGVKRMQKDTVENDIEDVTETKPVLVFAGPSGVGKSTLIHRLMKNFEGVFAYSVSYTTRERREREKDGVDYVFVTTEQFEEMIENEEFVEYAKVHGKYYGTAYESVNRVMAKGKYCILDLDVQGVEAVREKLGNGLTWEPRFVWIAPPSIESLEKRLKARGTETEQTLKNRLDTALRELQYAATKNVFDITVINDDYDAAYQELNMYVAKELGLEPL